MLWLLYNEIILTRERDRQREVEAARVERENPIFSVRLLRKAIHTQCCAADVELKQSIVSNDSIDDDSIDQPMGSVGAGFSGNSSHHKKVQEVCERGFRRFPREASAPSSAAARSSQSSSSPHRPNFRTLRLVNLT